MTSLQLSMTSRRKFVACEWHKRRVSHGSWERSNCCRKASAQALSDARISLASKLLSSSQTHAYTRDTLAQSSLVTRDPLTATRILRSTSRNLKWIHQNHFSSAQYASIGDVTGVCSVWRHHVSSSSRQMSWIFESLAASRYQVTCNLSCGNKLFLLPWQRSEWAEMKRKQRETGACAEFSVWRHVTRCRASLSLRSCFRTKTKFLN